MPALRAGGGSRPRPLGASLPPPAACGPLPLPTLGGLGAARPARLRRSGSCGGWSPPAAAQVCAPSGLASRQPLRGATQSGRKAKPPSGAASRALPPASPAPVAASVLRAAPPPLVGALGRCGPPARACLAPASRPALARLRLCPRWCGSACARPARRSGPAPLAASRRRAAGRRPRPLGASRARPQFRRRALGPCPLCGSRPLSAPRAAGARGYAACGRECHSGDTPRKAKASRLRRALRGDRLRGKDANKGARPLWPHTVRPTHHRKE